MITKWIECRERLPQRWKWVIVYDMSDGETFVAYRSWTGKSWVTRSKMTTAISQHDKWVENE